MGKQLQIAATIEDENLFIQYLRESFDIAIIESFADTRAKLWVGGFNSELHGHWSYYLWNKAFHWEPAYSIATSGNHYISNVFDAPLIEFSRSNVPCEKYGRIYWAKEFVAPKGLTYDVDAFSAWYNKIVKWVRKNATEKMKWAGINTYFLPNAWLTKCNRSK